MILSFLVSLLAFMIIISIVVFVHEFGHYIIAIKNGVQVDEFAIGYGKEIFGWTDKRGTRWKVCYIPCGGYVKFFADEDEASSVTNREKLEKLTDEEKKKCLFFKTVWQRIQVVAAGPVFNYLLAIVFFTLFFMFGGITIFSNEISKVEVDGPAYKAGILAGDKIIKIGDKNIENFEDIKTELLLNVKENLNLTIDRKGEVFEKTVIPEIKYDKKTKNPYLGIISNEAIHKKVGFFTAGGESLKQVWKISITTLKALGQMITAKRGFDDVGGPIKIAQYSGKAMKAGFSTMIYFIALISVSLGFMNLLPIPVLDGGHLLFYIIEAITKKPVNEKVENFLSKVFYGLLILLMLLITIKDIKGIF